MPDVRTFNSAQELLDHLAGRTANCRTTTKDNADQAKAAAATNQSPVQTSGYAQATEKTTGAFPPPWLGKTQAAPEPKPEMVAAPTTINAVVSVESPQKPKYKLRNIGVGQAIRLQSGNVIYRLGPKLYLYIGPFNLTVHYSIDSISYSSVMEGELLPINTKITIKL